MSRRPPANDDTEHGVLRRWSRRKARADQTREARVPAPEVVPESDEGVEALQPDDRTPEEGERVKTDEDMPDLDSINEASNMSDFFSPGVSEQLRNQALRRLFRMSKFNVTDGLDDYNQDFRNFALLGDTVTSDMRHRMEMDEQRRREAEEAADASPDGEPATAESVEESEQAEQEADQEAASTAGADESAGGNQGQTDIDSGESSRTRT